MHLNITFVKREFAEIRRLSSKQDSPGSSYQQCRRVSEFLLNHCLFAFDTVYSILKAFTMI